MKPRLSPFRRGAAFDALSAELAAEGRVLRTKQDTGAALSRLLLTAAASGAESAQAGEEGRMQALMRVLRSSQSAPALVTEVLVRKEKMSHNRPEAFVSGFRATHQETRACGVRRTGLLAQQCRVSVEPSHSRSADTHGHPQEFALCQSADTFYYGER